MNKQFLVGVFKDEDTLMTAVRSIKKAGIKMAEIYTPYPIHEAIEAMGKKSRFTFAAFLFGFIGAISILGFLQYTAVFDWPINYGGKPTNAFPSFIVVTLVLTILTITLASLFTFSVRAKVYPGKSPVIADERAMDDKFIIVFDMEENAQFSSDIETILRESGAEEIDQKKLQPLI